MPKPTSTAVTPKSEPAVGPACPHPGDLDPRVGLLVTDLIGRVADKWTMLILEALAEHEVLRFTQLRAAVAGISQKMLTQTLRHMERDGLASRTVYAVVPPRVEYRLSPLGFGLGAAFCGVWTWAEEHLQGVEQARREFDAKASAARTTWPATPRSTVPRPANP